MLVEDVYEQIRAQTYIPITLDELNNTPQACLQAFDQLLLHNEASRVTAAAKETEDQAKVCSEVAVVDVGLDERELKDAFTSQLTSMQAAGTPLEVDQPPRRPEFDIADTPAGQPGRTFCFEQQCCRYSPRRERCSAAAQRQPGLASPGRPLQAGRNARHNTKHHGAR